MSGPRFRRLAFAALFCCGPAFAPGFAPAFAQAPAKPRQAAAATSALSPNDAQPIQIQADSGIEWQQNTKTYVARGHAVATRGPTELHADTLIAHYRDAKGGNAGGNTEIYRVDAEGNVLIRKEGETIIGDRAVYDVDQAVGVVTGKNLKVTTATDTITARDRFDWYDQKQIGVARGDAVAVRNGKTIRADVLTAYMTKNPAPGPAKPGDKPKQARTPVAAKPGAPGLVKPGGNEDSKLSRVDAQGHVVVTNGTDVGQSDYGVYNAQTGIVTLIGNAVITRDKDVIRGQYAVMDLNTNVSRMMPSSAGTPGQHQQVRGLFMRRDPATGQPAVVTQKPNAAPTPAPAPAKAQ
ncbi:MAG TPA: LptA/OstA family protein [Stellaceae bacterium]|nr:LptA/OstA family protein [Stellaceae bacterium]